MKRERRSPAAGPVAAVLAAALLAPPLAAAEPPGAATPQALVERLNAAARNRDVAEVANCLAPEQRDELVLGMVAATGLMVGFMKMSGDLAVGVVTGMGGEGEVPAAEGMTDEQKAAAVKARAEALAKVAAIEKRYQATIDKYGLGDLMSGEGGAMELGQNAASARERLAGVDAGALLGELMALFEEMGAGNPLEANPETLPKEITGLVVEGDHASARAGDEAVELVEIDGRWYLRKPHPTEH
jgi:hypothetical protein